MYGAGTIAFVDDANIHHPSLYDCSDYDHFFDSFGIIAFCRRCM